MFLSGTKDLVRVGRKWKIINIQVTLRLRKQTKTLRKSVILFAKIDVWVCKWLKTWWVLTERVRQIMWKKRPNLWKNVWMLHQDNAPAHNALSVKMFLPDKRISILEHSPYSRIWHPVTLFCTTKWKVYWREPIFHQLMRWRQKLHSYWMTWGLIALLWTMEITNAAVCSR